MLTHHFTVYKRERKTLTHSDMEHLEGNVCLSLALKSFDLHQCMFTFLLFKLKTFENKASSHIFLNLSLYILMCFMDICLLNTLLKFSKSEQVRENKQNEQINSKTKCVYGIIKMAY